MGVGDVSGTTVVFFTSAARLVPARSQLVDQRLARDVTGKCWVFTHPCTFWSFLQTPVANLHDTETDLYDLPWFGAIEALPRSILAVCLTRLCSWDSSRKLGIVQETFRRMLAKKPGKV